MCKVAIVAGITDKNRDKVWAYIKAIAKPMSKYNNDGIGYSAITKEGDLFGERWLNNDMAFKRQEGIDDVLFEELGDAIAGRNEKPKDGEFNSFGDVKLNEMVAITLHTRSATSPRGMNNTHPFVENGISLIHNGVIRNEKDFKLTLSTCDSEAILKTYIENNVIADPLNFRACAEALQGYYACGVLANTPTGPILDVFKSSAAQLHVAYVNDLETYVVGTNETDIKDTCKELGFTIGQVYSILPGKFLRFDAITSKKLSLTAFDEWSYSKSHPTQSSTYTPSRITGKITTTTTADNIYNINKKKGNTQVSGDMMNYFNAGKVHCSRLSDREIQEEIMLLESLSGRV
jgi:hypothetical protein